MDTSALSQNLRDSLKVKNLNAKSLFKETHPHAQEFFDSVNFNLSQARLHSAKLLTAGTLGGALLLSSGRATASLPPSSQPIFDNQSLTQSQQEELYSKEWLGQQLHKLLPPIHNAFALPFLSPSEEKLIGRAIEKGTGVRATAVLEGERLNSIYGYIGAEQHLRRWPGDSIDNHGELAHVEGMAPGNGGFGFFAQGMQDQEGIEREKYYVAVQTLYLPDWNKRTRYLVNWYKWRKVIVVNADTGAAVVAVVGDAGPAAWTGKHFGGSPEVMHELGGKRYKKGRVLLMFVDDPNNTVPLGPVQPTSDKITPTLEALLRQHETQQN